jgi:hypothetical protein
VVQAIFTLQKKYKSSIKSLKITKSVNFGPVFMASLAHLVHFKKPVATGCNRFFKQPRLGATATRNCRKLVQLQLAVRFFSSPVQSSCRFFAVASTQPEDTKY